MQEFSDSKNGNTDIELLLYRNQPPQAPPSQITSTSSSFFTENEVPTQKTKCPNLNSRASWSAAAAAAAVARTENAEMRWRFRGSLQPKEQNGPTTSNPWNQEQHQEAWRLKTLLLGNNKRSSNDASGTHQHDCHFVLERGDDDQGFLSPSWWEACQTQPRRRREPLGPHFLPRTPPNSFQS